MQLLYRYDQCKAPRLIQWLSLHPNCRANTIELVVHVGEALTIKHSYINANS